jgi:GntR family transcriptional regulator
VSRYLEIADQLKKQILAGVYMPLAQLPSQRELARSLNTTVVTVRQAIDVLQNAGLLRSLHGLGTFVADIGRLDSFAEAMASQGIEVETRLMGISERAANPSAREALHLPQAEDLIALTRLRLVGGRPVALQQSYLGGRFLGVIRDYTPAIALYTHLRDSAGLVATSYHETVTTRAVTPQEARKLQVTSGSTSFVSRRTSFSDGEEPVLFDEALLPGERVSITVSRRGTVFEVSYRLTPGLAAPD